MAQKYPARIVFPEGQEERIIKAVEAIVKEGLCFPILIGNPHTIKNTAKKLRVKIDFKKIQIIDHQKSKRKKDYAQKFFNLRKEKGIKLDQAKKLMENINYFGTMMVHENDADGMISGTTFPTADTIRPALQIIKTKEPFHKVSGFFFMVLKKKLLLFADAAVNIEPSAHDLKDIASDTAITARKFGITPKIAFLSFSTNGSSKHPLVDKVLEAVALMKYYHPEIITDGEMQVDSALVPEVSKRKFPHSRICGDANVLIFPSLEAANIAYKLVERLAGASSIGPILQGLKKPINDLSRGCKWQDIVSIAAITSIEAHDLKYGKIWQQKSKKSPKSKRPI